MVRVSSVVALALLGACQLPPSVSEIPTPDVAVAAQWPAGTRFIATVSPGLPDQPKWRALRVWWDQALGQTNTFAACSRALLPQGDVPRISLSVDPAAQTMTATLLDREASTLLASCSYADDSPTPDLLLAIDRLAWSARLALGEPASQPQAIAAITSSSAKVVIAVDDASELLHTGAFGSAHRTLRRARQLDGGSPFVLDQLAAMELLRGDPVTAQRIAQEALRYTERTSPGVQHRLARTLLLARAAREPSKTGTFDQQLLTLAKVGRRERPYADEPLWSAALAHNFLGEFDQALPLLEEMAERRPDHAFVPYHLGWACLGLRQADQAADHLAQAAMRLPAPWVLLPRAIALQEAGRTVELDRLLEHVLDEYGRASSNTLTHQVLRMQAACAVLANEPKRTRQLLLTDLRWLLKNPTALKNLAGEFAEQGAVLVRLGSDNELPLLLSAIQREHGGTIVADASAFVAGMHQIRTTGKRPVLIERSLARDGDNAWAALLAAYSHERLGEVGEMQNELAKAARLSSSPMTKALLAHSLRAVGKLQEAALLQDTLRVEMLRINLRQSCQHPVFGPELAYAYTLR